MREKELREKMQWAMKFMALQRVVESLLMHEFTLSTNLTTVADEWLRWAEKNAATLPFEEIFRSVSPEQNAVARREYRDSLVRLIHRARALATGEPFDPERFRYPVV